MSSVKPCEAGKIVNPLTNKCVKVDGGVAKELLKKHNSKVVELHPQVVKAIKTALGMIVTPVATPKTPKTPNAVQTQTKTPTQKFNVNNKLKAWAAKAKAKVADKKGVSKGVSDLVKAYCKGNTKVKPPELNKQYVYRVPIATFQEQDMEKYLNNNGNNVTLTTNYNQILKFGFSSHNEKWRLAHQIGHESGDGVEKYVEKQLDLDWFAAQNEYKKKLSFRDVFTLLGYTKVGDVWANEFMRGSLDEDDFFQAIDDKFFFKSKKEAIEHGAYTIFPLFFTAIDELMSTSDLDYHKIIKNSDIHKTIKVQNKKELVTDMISYIKQNGTINNLATSYFYIMKMAPYLTIDFWKKCIQRFCDDLQRIIDGAPKLKKQMIVYRGVKNDYYLKHDVAKLKHIKVYKNDGFVSTSINVQKSFNFTALGKGCCLKKITLLPGSSALMLMGTSFFNEESEVLLGLKTEYFIRKSRIPMKLYDNMEYSVCVETAPTNLVTVSDIVVVK
jgi:hypothetical protein